MFTGLIEEIGYLEKMTKKGKGFLLSISCKIVLEGLKVGDSIAVNGICLTASAFNKRSFSAFVMKETLEMTTMAVNKKGPVNLERALLLGGHIVMGHITGIGEI